MDWFCLRLLSRNIERGTAALQLEFVSGFGDRLVVLSDSQAESLILPHADIEIDPPDGVPRTVLQRPSRYRLK